MFIITIQLLIRLDPEFIQFLESLDKEEEKLPSAEIYIEEIEAAKAIDKNSKFIGVYYYFSPLESLS